MSCKRHEASATNLPIFPSLFNGDLYLGPIGDAMVTGVKDAMTDTTHHLWLNPSPDFLGYLIPCDEYNDSPPGDDAYEEGVSLGTCADGWITQPLQGLIVNDEFPH